MKVINPGHLYRLDNIGRDDASTQDLQFVENIQARKEVNILRNKRAGVTNKEVFLMLLDRMQFLNNLFPCTENDEIITHIEACLELTNKRETDRMQRGVLGKAEK